MKAQRRGCELCGGAAAVHCEADAAHLCWPCDARVHGANFLVARHVRRVACAGCGALGDDRLLVGAGSPAPIRAHLCGACAAAAAAASDDESESGSCISSAESAAVASPGRRGEAAIRAAATARPRRRRGDGAGMSADRGVRGTARIARSVVRAGDAARDREEGWAECCSKEGWAECCSK